MTTIDNNQIYEVAIVGAGPAGATCAYYLAEKGIDVLLIDKEIFPRRKICGDAITVRAQHHLERMGVLQEVLEEKKGHWAAKGGIVGPSGIHYFGDSTNVDAEHLVIAIKRQIMDEKIVRAAEEAGIKLIENYFVKDVQFSSEKKYWTLRAKDESKQPLKAKVLIVADGAASRIARSLELVAGPPQATCSSVYIKAGTHEFQQDGVCYYPPKLVPGYCALFKEADGDLVYCCYIIPGGEAKKSDLRELHHEFLENYSFIRDALGPNAEIEKMKAAPIRFGGIPKSYGDHLLIIGDAAGQIDPLTGEGIQYALDAAEIAAETIALGKEKNNYSEQILKNYQKNWMKSFGKDFKWSSRMVKVFANNPIFVDAFASVCKRKGDKFMREWGKIMTGSKRKLSFFLPRLAFPLLFEVLKLIFRKE
ncbi:MAG: geranylgeranyl reductase family protein [Candidatus Heimdallarchaeota archaeon]|nr:geranylgeranyl reductase family protein [Candidatus Heimdallarchaeota archaeon]